MSYTIKQTQGKPILDDSERLMRYRDYLNAVRGSGSEGIQTPEQSRERREAQRETLLKLQKKESEEFKNRHHLAFIKRQILNFKENEQKFNRWAGQQAQKLLDVREKDEDKFKRLKKETLMKLDDEILNNSNRSLTMSKYLKNEKFLITKPIELELKKYQNLLIDWSKSLWNLKKELTKNLKGKGAASMRGSARSKRKSKRKSKLNHRK